MNTVFEGKTSPALLEWTATRSNDVHKLPVIHRGSLLLDCFPDDVTYRIGTIHRIPFVHNLIDFLYGVRWQPNSDLNIVIRVHVGINWYLGI